MRLYPAVDPARRRTILADLTVLLCIAAFALIAIEVHHQIAGVDRVTAGVVSGTDSVQRSFDAAASDVSGLPLVGGRLSSGLRRAGAQIGAPARRSVRQANHELHVVADLAAWLIFGLPTLVLLARHGSRRAAQIRTMSSARRMLAAVADPSLHRLIAERAVFSLAPQVLLRHTREPFADLAAGRLGPLIAAAMEDAGVSGSRPR